MTDTEEHRSAFENLTPDHMLDAVESIGLRCDGRFLALNSYENRVYRIGLEEGGNIVAKFYRPGRWSDEAILEEHAFTRELAEQEIPVVAPSEYDGVTLHHQSYHRFAIYPSRGGRAPELDDPDQLEQMGRFIARIHSLGATSRFEHRSRLDIATLVDEPRSFLLENDWLPAHIIEAYESVTADLRQSIVRCFEIAGGVPSLRLHGDLHPGNVLWTDDGPHIVDFDDCRTGPAIQDLWMFLSGDREYMATRFADLMEGYTQFRSFDAAELILIEALRSMRIIHYAYWLASRWDDPAFKIAFPWFGTPRFWEDHVLELREQQSAIEEPAIIWR